MIFRNAVTGVLHWDFVSLKQLSSFTPSLKLNIMPVCSRSFYQLPCHRRSVRTSFDFSSVGAHCNIRATGSIKMNLTTVGELGRVWQSQPLIDFERSLVKPTSHANAGNLQGNRMFFTNDYIVGFPFSVYLLK